MGKSYSSSWNWNSIFLFNRTSSSKSCEENQKIYNGIKKEQYATLDDCIRYAIKNENHAAFVHFFFEKTKERKAIFLKVFEKYLFDYEKEIEKNKNLIKWGNRFQLLHPEYWTSYDFDYTKENLDKYSYQPANLTNWRSYIDKGIPSKDVIVQCCLYFGKNIEETNKLLIAAGYDQLYVLDIIDTIEMYYLEKYHNNFEIDQFEKLKQVKVHINNYLKSSSEFDDDIIRARKYKKKRLLKKDLNKNEVKVIESFAPRWRTENNRDFVYLSKIFTQKKEMKNGNIQYDIVDKKGVEAFGRRVDGKKGKIFLITSEILGEDDDGTYLFWDVKTEELYRHERKDSVILGEKSPLGWKIDEEIQRYREILELDQKCNENISNTDYLTFLYERKFDKVSIDDFIKKGRLSDKVIFVQKRYGFLSKTLQYLNKYENYKKNIQYSSVELISSYHKKISLIEKSFKRTEYLNLLCEEFGKSIQEKKKIEEMDELERRELLLEVVNSIWEISEIEPIIKSKSAKASKYFKVKSLIEGIDILEKRKDFRKESDISTESQVYVMDITKKIDLIKYAVATGREDEISKYLMYAGFWKEDLFSVANLEEKELADQTDFLIVYAKKYRDALLEMWADKLKVDKDKYMKDIKSEFPFIKLLMIINRDIQFVEEKILLLKNIDLKDKLIYPVDFI